MAAKKKRNGSGQEVSGISELDAEKLFEWIYDVHDKARFVAVKLGVLPEWFEGDDATIRRIIRGLDFYHDTFKSVEIMAQPVIEYAPVSD